jgi:YNFM family putative membrane transporter
MVLRAAGPWSRIVLGVALIKGAAGFGILAISAAHLHQHLHLPLSVAGGIVSLFGMGGMLYMAVARHLIPRFGERGLALSGGVVRVWRCLPRFFSSANQGVCCWPPAW